MLTGARRGSATVIAAAALLWAGAATFVAATPPRVAAAQTDLSFVSSSTWTADPLTARVHVRVALTATSHTVDTNVRRFFYDDVEMTLPPAATGISAASIAGDPLTVVVQNANASGVTVAVPLGQRLYSGESGSVNLNFDIVDKGGTTDRDLRLSRNLMSFPVSAFGSPGVPGSAVTVIFPSGFSVQEEFGGLPRSVYGSGEVSYSSGILDDSTTFSAWFTAVQPVPETGFLVRTVMIGPLQVALRYWADDPGWADRVEFVLSEGYPALRDLIGLGDPSATSLTVVEASTQEIGGFSGSYDQATGQVHISYFADPFVILHETAHMWFNSGLSSERWIEEGFSSYYAERTVLELNLVDHAPLLTPRLSQGAVPLNDWLNVGQPSSVTDAYLYAGTLDVARRIAALAGEDGLRKVWSAAQARTSAYQPIHSSATESSLAGPIDWRGFLDLLEQMTGQHFDSIWSLWVVDSAQGLQLDKRAAALDAYAVALTQAGQWELPTEIRRDLGTWQFDAAVAAIGQARTVLTQRDEISSLAETEGTSPPPTLRTLFERTSVAAASAEATNELAVLSALAEARQAESASQGGARALGLLGANPAADLTAAQKKFAAGDMPGAMNLAASARSAWQGANGTGQARIFGIVAVATGMVLMFLVFTWTRRGRRPRQSAFEAGGSARDASVAAPAGADASSATAASVPVESPRRRKNRFGAAPLAVAGDGSAPELGSEAGSAARSTASGSAAVGGGESATGAGSAAGATPVPGVAPVPGAAPANIPAHAEGPSGNGKSHPHPATGSGNGKSHNGSGSDSARDAAEAGSGRAGRPAMDADSDVGDPDESAYDLLQRGTALLADRHNAQAAVVLERAARVEPGKGSILEALGRAYFNSGQHARAAETFEALLEIDPSAHYGHFALGLSFARLGRPIEARAHLRLAVALDPASETYRKALDKAESARV